MHTSIYDLSFNEEEKKQIHGLRRLDKNRKVISWLVGIMLVLVTFFSQVLFHGITWIHATATYGCLPIGITVGLYLSRTIDKYIESEFQEKWDRLYFERNDTTAEKEAAKEDVIRLTDSMEFYSLPIEVQKQKIAEIYKNHGVK